MKRAKWMGLLVATAMATGLSAQEDVLFSIGEQQVTAEEFRLVYEKNKAIGTTVDPKTPEEYLDLYINFKLKIAEAYAQERDQSAAFQREFGGYRAQLAKPYLSESNIETEMMQEAYERLQEEVRASHIMTALGADALPSDTAIVYKAMMDLRDQILSGKVTFEGAARKRSSDTWSAERGGDLGYFSAFNMVYPFESGAYNLEVGEISKPIRSQFGYHLIKLTDRRPASGKVTVRHIFFAAGQDDSATEKERAERSAREIYTRLTNGESFFDLVEQYSEDKKTSKRGGELPAFGINEMMPEFEAAAFALKAPGDFSEPVQTSIGWHVLQLVGKETLGSFEEMKPTLAAQVKRDSRSQLGQTRFLERLKKEYHFSVDEKVYDRTVKLVDFAAYVAAEWTPETLRRDRVVASWDGGALMQSELLEAWSKQQRVKNASDLPVHLRGVLNKISDVKLLEFEDGQLETKYPEFRHLVREYKEGILLFELTQDEVWNKAARDSAGIAEEYERIKGNHLWGDRIGYTYWTCSEERTAKKIAQWMKADRADKVERLLEKEAALDISTESGVAEQKDATMFETLWSTELGVHGPVALPDGKFAVLMVNEVWPSEPKALDEIRGLVIASYQDRLEQQWVESLKKKYPVKRNEEVIARVMQSLK